ncbi:HpcH/HpaI aldolase/citrate lyase family protein [Nocardioides humi]|uniref:CoA ester lyase n=1 Tax=Nocardioides humi TaxID=449461 RepID=A0ABN1ZWL8_9ACTN|nr:CoA ester lyase [Nocardioides humi]
MSGTTWLFCPADRPDRYQKAASVSDVVILDLEDGVAPSQRDAARRHLLKNPLDASRTVVRLNPLGTRDHDDDLRMLAQTDYRRVLLAKTESAEQVQALESFEVVALIETPLGVRHAWAIAAATPVVALMWGAEDLVAGLGGRTSRKPDGTYHDVARTARSTALLAARAADRMAVDAVYLDIADHVGLADETAEAVQVGFGAKACIHPSHVEVIRAAYRPTDEEVTWAEKVLSSASSTPGVFQLDGMMIDGPLIRQAEAILRRQ